MEGNMTAQIKELTPRRIGLMVFVVAIFAFTPLIVSGRWDWWEAWIYAAISTVGFVASRLLVSRRHPGLIDERARSMEMEGAKSWDRLLAPLVALGGVLIAVLAGLDHRFGWSTALPLWIKLASLVIFILGYLLGTWAMLENEFFSGVVRIQKDRGHSVVSTGPYAWVRHPGYASALFVYLITPLLLDSIWSFIPALMLVIVLVLRTALEDRTLQEELPGYKEFTKKTKYRLIPGIW